MKLCIGATTITAAIVWGLGVFCVGVLNLKWGSYGTEFLTLISSVYPGYKGDHTFVEVLIATGYALLDGAVGGFLFAVIYNTICSCCRCKVCKPDQAG
jgi:hypothetical protein